MIEFSCPQCGRSMRVADEHAGKKGKCKDCGTPVKIPEPVQAKSASMQSDFEIPLPAIAPPTPTPRQKKSRREVATVVVPNQVNLSINTPRSNGTAIAGLILGIVGLVVFWMPFAGIGIGGVGLLLATISIFVALFRRGTGLGYGIGGAVVSIVAILANIPATAVGTVVVAGAVDQADKAAKRAKAKQEIQAALQEAAKENPNNPLLKPLAQPTPVAPQKTDPPPPVSIKVVEMGAPAMLGPVSITVERASIGNVQWKNRFTQKEMESKDPFLQIWIRCKNTTNDKKLRYTGWDIRHVFGEDYSALVDDKGNDYRRINSFSDERIDGVTTDSSLYPGKDCLDVVVFETPVEAATGLILTLKGFGVDQEGEVRFRIPAAAIQKN